MTKEVGGLGIKDIYFQYVAFIMKLCWGLITKPKALWVKCLKNKYACGDEKYPKVVWNAIQSGIWGGISKVWDKFLECVGSSIHGGHETKVWSELWSSLELPLLQYVDKNWHLINMEDTVSHFMLDGRGWNDAKFRMSLPEWIIGKIHMVRPGEGRHGDKFCWRHSGDGNFTVKSAYEISSRINNAQGNRGWKKIWTGGATKCANFLMWQAFQERVPTNV